MSNENNKILKEAQYNKEKGLNYLKISYIFCKCKPDYEGAIPYLKSAAKEFNLLKNDNEELICRENLVKCFKILDSLWEEGNENELISEIYIRKKEYNKSIYSILNAHEAYYSKGEYDDCIKCVLKISKKLIENKLFNECESLLKGLFDSLLKFAHILYTNDIGYHYVFEGFHSYVSILAINSKYLEISKSCDLIIKSLKGFIKKDEDIFMYFYIYVISLILLDDKDNFHKVYAEASSYAYKDNIQYESILKIFSSIDKKDKDEFQNNLYIATNNIDNIFSKLLFLKFNSNNKVDKELIEEKDFL